MVPVAGRPVLRYLLEWLRAYGIQEVAINLHYRPEAIRGALGDGAALGVRLTYSYEARLLGSAGALGPLASFLDCPFVVVYGDVLTTLDLAALAAAHRRGGAPLTLALYEADNPTECGIVGTDPPALAPGGDGRVVRFVEKPAPEEVFSTLANAGVYLAQPEVARWVRPGERLDFGQDLFPESGCGPPGWARPTTCWTSGPGPTTGGPRRNGRPSLLPGSGVGRPSSWTGMG